MLMSEVVRISDRFMDRRCPDSIDAQGKLGQFTVLVMIAYCVMGIACVQFQALERKHPRIIPDLDVTFEFNAPPPEPTYKVAVISQPIDLFNGNNANPGSEDSAKPLEAPKLTVPAVEAPQVEAQPTPIQAKPMVSRTTTVAPPIAVTPTNLVKAAPAPQPKLAMAPPEPSPITGARSDAPTSGAPVAGGAPDGAEGGVGRGGEGVGGGVGQGDPGAGTGFGTAGGEIAKMPTPGARAMGNIAPYKRDMLLRIAQHWHPKKKNTSCLVRIILSHDGKLLDSEVIESSGSKKVDNEALEAVGATEFAPLPDWFNGEQLQFKVELAKVEASQ